MGKVVDKRIENSENLIEFEAYVENQEGQNVAPGRVTVALPSKG